MVFEPMVGTSQPFVFGAVGEAQAAAIRAAAETRRATERRSVILEPREVGGVVACKRNLCDQFLV